MNIQDIKDPIVVELDEDDEDGDDLFYINKCNNGTIIPEGGCFKCPEGHLCA